MSYSPTPNWLSVALSKPEGQLFRAAQLLIRAKRIKVSYQLEKQITLLDTNPYRAMQMLDDLIHKHVQDFPIWTERGRITSRDPHFAAMLRDYLAPIPPEYHACEWCGHPFTSQRKTKRYCCDGCRSKAFAHRHPDYHSKEATA